MGALTTGNGTIVPFPASLSQSAPGPGVFIDAYTDTNKDDPAIDLMDSTMIL
jgi:hypothetical protein